MTSNLSDSLSPVGAWVGAGPVYQQVSEYLRKRAEGMGAGERLPSERKLALGLNIDRATLRRALLHLENEGYIIRQQGRGTFVTDQSSNAEPSVNRANLLGLDVSQSTMNGKGLALIIPDLEIPSHVGLLNGMLEHLAERNVKAWVNSSMLDAGYERELLSALSKQDVFGVITIPIFGNSQDAKYVEVLQQLVDSGKRVVLAEQYVGDRSISSVMVNQVKSSYMLTEHLIMDGHRKVALFSTNQFTGGGTAFFRGYEQAMGDYDQSVDSSLVFNISGEECAQPAYEKAKTLLSDKRFRCSAICAAPFSMAYGVFRAIKELGLEGSVELVGQDLHFNPELAHLSHVRQPFKEVGRQAVELLLSNNASKGFNKHILIEPEFVVRDQFSEPSS